MKKTPVTYKIYCPGCKHLWILHAPEEVTNNVYQAWFETVVIEHNNLKDQKHKNTDQKNITRKKWWEFWK